MRCSSRPKAASKLVPIASARGWSAGRQEIALSSGHILDERPEQGVRQAATSASCHVPGTGCPWQDVGSSGVVLLPLCNSEAATHP